MGKFRVCAPGKRGAECRRLEAEEERMKHDLKVLKVTSKVELKKVDEQTDLAKALAKQETKSTAYKNGIDPNAAMWKSISDMTESVGGVVSTALNPVSVIGGGKETTPINSRVIDLPSVNTSQSAQSFAPIVALGGVVLVLVYMFKK